MKQLNDYFYEEIVSISVRRKYKLQPAVQAYLSSILAESIKDVEPHCLFDMYMDALNCEYGKLKKFKKIGDYTLVKAGYFTDSVGDLSYYIDMGQTAYGSINISLFKVLQQEYKTCLCLLNELSTENKKFSKDNIIDLYKFWLATGSIKAHAELLKLGMIVLPENKAF